MDCKHRALIIPAIVNIGVAQIRFVVKNAIYRIAIYERSPLTAVATVVRQY